jgi:hypothetical protein
LFEAGLQPEIKRVDCGISVAIMSGPTARAHPFSYF